MELAAPGLASLEREVWVTVQWVDINNLLVEDGDCKYNP